MARQRFLWIFNSLSLSLSRSLHSFSLLTNGTLLIEGRHDCDDARLGPNMQPVFVKFVKEALNGRAARGESPELVAIRSFDRALVHVTLHSETSRNWCTPDALAVIARSRGTRMRQKSGHMSETPAATLRIKHRRSMSVTG